jgi:RNA polymerase sigma-70 factor (ECF subfamily)
MSSACLAPSVPGFDSAWLRLSVMMPPSDNPSPPDEAAGQAALLRRVQRGDRDALARLYDLLAKPLYSLALRVTGDAAEAQDVVHDAFLQLWHKSGDFDPARGTVFSWAATFVRNRAIDRVRMRRRREDLLAAQPADAVAPQPLTAGDSADNLLGREKAAAVRAALGALAPDQRAAIELAYFSGLTQQEISAKLNEPLGTVKARIRRGLLRLRDALPAGL